MNDDHGKAKIVSGDSPKAETRSAHGDLAEFPPDWLQRHDYLTYSRPGTSLEAKYQPPIKAKANTVQNALQQSSIAAAKPVDSDKKVVPKSGGLGINHRGELRQFNEPFSGADSGTDVNLCKNSSSRKSSRTHRTTASSGAAFINDASSSSAGAGGGRRRGHLRGTRSNGFASGPPFAKPKPSEGAAANGGRYSYYWGTTPAELQKQQQQIELIEKEINVMAQESQCGIDKWRPKWLQRFATKKWMLFLLCWFCAIQGMLINGLVPSSISTIERRFELSTSTIGRIMQFYDFGYVLFCIPVSYFGGRHSKSTVLGAGLSLMVLGSFIFTMPHFIAEPFTSAYNADSSGLSKCNDGNSSSLASVSGAGFDALRACPSPENQPGNFRYVFLFCLAHFLHGIGATPLFTIGVSYIDENVGPALSSLYLGIFYAFAIFGPAFGFLASSTFLRWHTDFLQAGKRFASILSLDETDPKWVGAWYLGFLLVSVLGALAIFPILILPKVLPESLKWHRTRLREETLGAKKRTPECCGMPSSSKTAVISGSLSQIEERGNTVAIMPSLKNRSAPIWYQLWLDVRHIPIAIYRILLNGPYMLITLGMAIDGLIVTGCSTFMSKYLERQFGVAPSKANMLIGAVMVPMAGCGTMLAGFMIHHFRMSCVRTLQFCLALLVCSLCLSPMYFIYCDHDQLVGIERHYPVDDDISNHYDNVTEYYNYHLESSCNSQCQCHYSEYYPVCAEFSDGSQVAFYSPCYAGCQQMYSPLQKEYLNCSCAPTSTKGGYRRVKKGFCESKCRGLFAFLFFFAPFCFFTFAVGVALITVVLRTVDYDERSFALGIQWILVRIIGTIPAPVVFGWLFDVSCVRRHMDPCSGAHGSCMLYHNKNLADLFFAFSLAGALVAIACLLMVLIFFASSLRDDPLPASAVDAPDLTEGNDDASAAMLRENPMDDEEQLAAMGQMTAMHATDDEFEEEDGATTHDEDELEAFAERDTPNIAKNSTRAAGAQAELLLLLDDELKAQQKQPLGAATVIQSYDGTQQTTKANAAVKGSLI